MEYISLLKDVGVFFGLISLFVIFRFIGRNPYYAINFFFIARFLLRFVMPGAQVRFQVTASILIIAFCMLAVKTYSLSQSDRINDYPAFRGIIKVLLAVVPIEVLIGILNGYNLFQIGVDVYKVSEIILFFVFIQYIWRDTLTAEKSFNLLVVEMCIIGFIEMFITSRGGVGLNMIMSFFPIFYALGFVERRKYYWLICAISMAIIVFCQTRTYLIGILAGLAIICITSKGIFRGYIVRKSIGMVCIAVLLVIMMEVFFNSSALDIVLSRFNELFDEGFEGAGGYRIYEIRKALEKFNESPILGQGYGYLEYLYIELMGYFNWGDFMHNIYVEILCKTGLYGTLIYGVGIILYIRYLVAIRNECLDNNQEASAAVLNGGIGGTISWLVIYAAAPLSSYGYIFLPGIISIVYYHLYVNEFEYEYVNNCHEKSSIY